MQSVMPALKISGYSSTSRLEDIFASQMIDVAYPLNITEEYALVVSDAPEQINLTKERDREWLIAVIQETMKIAGENNVQITYIPPSP